MGKGNLKKGMGEEVGGECAVMCVCVCGMCVVVCVGISGCVCVWGWGGGGGGGRERGWVCGCGHDGSISKW